MNTTLFLAVIFNLITAYSSLKIPEKSLQANLDPRLVGIWIYTNEKSTGSGATFVNHVTKTKWEFRADGTFEKGSSQTLISDQAENAWSEADQKGTWRSRANQIVTPMLNSKIIPLENRIAGTYYIEGGKMVFTDLNGKKAIWRKEFNP